MAPPFSTFRLLLLITPLLLLSCAGYTDRRAEALLLDALPKLVGPADNYTATVQGASSDGTRIEQVQATGVRVRRPHLPVFERVELSLTGVVVDATAKRVTAVGDARLSLRLKVDDVAAYLGASEWIDRPAVRLSAPDKIFISGRPCTLPATVLFLIKKHFAFAG